MKNHNFIGVGGLLHHENKYLLVKHSYGEYNEQWIIPGGFVKDGEHPSIAVEREVMEETSIKAKADCLVAIRSRKRSEECIDCYLIFTLKYISGTPTSDGYENSDVGFFPYEDIMAMDNIIPLTKIIIEKHQKGQLQTFNIVKDIDPYTEKNDFLNLYL